MSLRIVNIVVERSVRTRTPSGGKTEVWEPVDGSPFAGRVYRRMQKTVERVEGAAGVTTVENERIIGFVDKDCPVKIGDVAILPDGERARIQRVRRYDWRCECDIETGAEGTT